MTDHGGASAERPRRAALLVVHGVGEQTAFSSLDRVVRGLRTVLGRRVDEMTHTSTSIDGRVTSGVRLSLNTGLPRSGARELDVFEAHWAPMASGLITTRGVLAWLQQTLLTPLRRWSQIRLDNVSLGRRLELVVGEVFASLAFTALLFIQLSIVLFFVTEVSANPFEGFEVRPIAVTEIAAVFVGVAFLIHALRGTARPAVSALRRRAHVWYVTRVLGERAVADDPGLDEPEHGAESRRIWGGAAWGGLVIAAAIALYIEIDELTSDDPDEPGRIEAISDFGQELWIALGLAAVAYVIGRFLTNIAGDVALYVADDASTSAGRFRTHIFESVQRQLRELLEDPAYDVVHVVGHSLGTVISYDIVNHFRTEVEHVDTVGFDDPELMTRDTYDRFGTLVTVACPLDHIAYLFRSDGRTSNPIQRQLLGRRRALRTEPVLVDDGRFSLDEEFATARRRGYYPSEPERFAWLNVKASPDPIGTELLNFRPDESHKVRFGPLALSAHVKVMADRRTYEVVLPYL